MTYSRKRILAGITILIIIAVGVTLYLIQSSTKNENQKQTETTTKTRDSQNDALSTSTVLKDVKNYMDKDIRVQGELTCRYDLSACLLITRDDQRMALPLKFDESEIDISKLVKVPKPEENSPAEYFNSWTNFTATGKLIASDSGVHLDTTSLDKN